MNTWIFQGNPDHFEIVEYLKKVKNDVIMWGIRKEEYIPLVKIDDQVYVWKSQGSIQGDLVGIIASGKIISEPKKMADDEPWRFTDPEKREEAETDNIYRVKIKIIEKRFKRNQGILEKHAIKDKLPTLGIITMPQGTNYRLNTEQEETLSELWNSTRK